MKAEESNSANLTPEDAKEIIRSPYTYAFPILDNLRVQSAFFLLIKTMQSIKLHTIKYLIFHEIWFVSSHNEAQLKNGVAVSVFSFSIALLVAPLEYY